MNAERSRDDLLQYGRHFETAAECGDSADELRHLFSTIPSHWPRPQVPCLFSSVFGFRFTELKRFVFGCVAGVSVPGGADAQHPALPADCVSGLVQRPGCLPSGTVLREIEDRVPVNPSPSSRFPID